MRHAHITDPETGIHYPIPAGGSNDDPPPEGGDGAGNNPEPTQAGQTDPPAPEGGQPDDGGETRPDGHVQLPDDHPILRTMRREREARQEVERQLQQIQQQHESDTERQLREAREQAAQEVRDEFLQERLEDRIRVAAARRLNDPEDAVRLLDRDGLDPSSESLASEIEARIGSLVESKPYLAVTGETPSGSSDAGSRTPPSQPAQLSRADLANMTPQQINEARLEGRLDDLLQGKSQ